MRSNAYISENQSSLQCCGVHFGCAHFLLSIISLLRSIVGFLLGTCSTVLVVPMFKVCAKIVDCIHPADGSKPYLSEYPNIHCYEATHWKLVGIFVVIVPIYFAALVPYAVVNGDSQFMPRASLLSPSSWRRSAVRKATLEYQGPMHPEADYILINRVAELLMKISLPVIVILTSAAPLLQTALIAIVGLIVYLVSEWCRPLVDPVTNSCIQGTELFTFLCMATGMFSVILPESKQFTTGLLIASVILTGVKICLQIRADEVEHSYGPQSSDLSAAARNLSARRTVSARDMSRITEAKDL